MTDVHSGPKFREGKWIIGYEIDKDESKKIRRAFEKLVLGRITKGWDGSGHPDLDDAMMRLPVASCFIE